MINDTTLEGQFNPFPGLRPFSKEENYLFFGREKHVEELVKRLKANRFAAVLGCSGSGKSSLVYAGLLPLLDGGVKTKTGMEWRVAWMRPGTDPVLNLAKAVMNPDFLDAAPAPGDEQLHLDMTMAALKRSNLGLIRVLQEMGPPPGENLLILVDQFEELFRFEGKEDTDRYDGTLSFVRLLLEAANQPEIPLYLLITMRSDFLGECVRFPGLAEAINNGQYLIPRLTRDQHELVITGPIKVAGAAIANPLLQQLLNDVGDNPDQLPILQHALMRTYDLWQRKNQPDQPIGLEDYRKTGGMAGALSLHAEEAFKGLSQEKKKITEALFKCLTYKKIGGQGIRRPGTLKEICALAAAGEKEVIEVIDNFRKPGRAFLMPPAGTRIDENSLIDISHESLMRIWGRLSGWVDEEAKAVEYYRRICQAAELYYDGEAGLMRDPQLELSLQWLEEHKPTAAWAARGGLPFERIMEFIELSRGQRDAETAAKEEARQRELEQSKKLARLERANTLILSRTAKRQRIWITAISAALVLMILSTLWAIVAWKETKKNYFKRAKAEIKALSQLSLYLFRSDKRLAALLKALEAGHKLGELSGLEMYQQEKDNPLRQGVETSLIQALSGIKEKNRWVGHGAWPNAIRYSPGGEFIVSAGYEKRIKRWRAGGGPLEPLAHRHQATVFALDVNKKNEIISGDGQGSIILWGADGSVVKTIKAHQGKPVRCLCFNGDGSLFASGGGDGAVHIWRRNGTGVFSSKQDTSPVRSLYFNSGGGIVIAGRENGTITIWRKSPVNPRDGGLPAVYLRQKNIPHHKKAVMSLDCNMKRKIFISGGSDGDVNLWGLNGVRRDSFRSEQAINAVRLGPDGGSAAAAFASGEIRHWRIHTETTRLDQRIEFYAHSEPVTGLDYSPDGRFLVSTGHDFLVKVWQVNNDFHKALLAHSEPVMGVDTSPGGKIIASCSVDRTVKLWGLDGKLSRIFTAGDSEEMVRAVRFSPDGRYIAWAGHDGTLTLRRPRGGEPARVLGKKGPGLNDVDFSPDSSLLMAAGLDGSIKCWRTSDGKLSREYDFRQREGATWGVRFGRKGRFISLSSDGNARLRSLKDDNYLHVLRGHEKGVVRADFSRDGRFIVTAGVDRAILWDSEGKQLYKLTDPGGSSNSGINGAVFSPDSSLVATAGRDGTVKLWHTRDGTLYKTLSGHVGGLNQVVFSPDGRRLVSCGADNTVRIWNNLYLSLAELMRAGEEWVMDYRELNETGNKK